MLCHLVPHPETPETGFLVYAIVSRPTVRELALIFAIRDSVPKIAWHEPEREGRADGLWKHSCFEAFVRPGTGGSYLELNLAPAKRWALYDFDGYRAGMRDSVDAKLHNVRFRSHEDRSIPSLRMRTTLELPSSFADHSWALGLSVIIEKKDGTKSYWALAHAPGPPDFHNRDCFIATLPAPDAA